METMSNLKDSTLDGVEDLIRINIDSGKGFETAAEQIENKDMASFFKRCGQRRTEFAGELQRVVGMNNESPPSKGTVAGSIHRWWLGVRGTVQNGSEHAVLAEAERGEDAIKARYERVIRETAGSPLNAVLLRQYACVKQDHDLIRDMRDARA